MANRRPLLRSFNAAELGLTPSNATTGVWASQLSSGVYSLHKAAAATTSVVNIPVPYSAWGPPMANEDAQISVIQVFYKVSTADLSSAPTVVLEKLTLPSTGVAAKTDITQVLTFGGVDAVGITSTSGSHIAIITVTGGIRLADTESLYAVLTMNEAATSVLDIFGIQVTYTN